MEAPTIKNILHDESKNIRYVILAYRTLTRNELLSWVRFGVSNMKKKPKRNSTYTFVTIIGHDGH